MKLHTHSLRLGLGGALLGTLGLISFQAPLGARAPQAPTQTAALPVNSAFPPSAFPPSASQLAVLNQQVDDNLQKQILGQWFPRSIDAAGGFSQNFAEDWSPQRETDRSIVYQARLTWLAAQAAGRYPAQRARYVEISNHGAAFLRDVMWDKANGGYFWQQSRLVAPDGTVSYEPQRNGEKNAYGIAFAIYALSANYSATRDPRSLDAAKQAFAWLETHSHDAQNGGYHEAMTREGQPILAQTAGGERVDPVGTRYGLKSMNSHIHLLEAFAALHEIWPDKALEARLKEVFLLVRDTVVETPPGAMALYFTPAWKPVPGHDSYGHDIETAYLLVEAAAALHMPDDERTWTVARGLVDHCLEVGLDRKNGGFYDSGSVTGEIDSAEKVWWVEAEALNSLLLMHEKYGAQSPRYWNAFLEQWNWIQNHQVDAKFGGWYPGVSPEGASFPGHIKSDGWTECYHQGRALLNVSAMLQKMGKAGKTK